MQPVEKQVILTYNLCEFLFVVIGCFGQLSRAHLLWNVVKLGIWFWFGLGAFVSDPVFVFGWLGFFTRSMVCMVLF